MNEESRKLLQQAQDLLIRLERKLTEELHAPVKRDGSKPRMKLAIEYGAVAAARAALDTVS